MVKELKRLNQIDLTENQTKKLLNNDIFKESVIDKLASYFNHCIYEKYVLNHIIHFECEYNTKTNFFKYKIVEENDKNQEVLDNLKNDINNYYQYLQDKNSLKENIKVIVKRLDDNYYVDNDFNVYKVI